MLPSERTVISSRVTPPEVLPMVLIHETLPVLPYFTINENGSFQLELTLLAKLPFEEVDVPQATYPPVGRAAAPLKTSSPSPPKILSETSLASVRNGPLSVVVGLVVVVVGLVVVVVVVAVVVVVVVVVVIVVGAVVGTVVGRVVGTVVGAVVAGSVAGSVTGSVTNSVVVSVTSLVGSNGQGLDGTRSPSPKR